jgi:hypothetical protein
MKKISLLTLVVMGAIVMNACAPTQAPEQVENPAPADSTQGSEDASNPGSDQSDQGICANPFHPVRENTRWTYQLTSNGEIQTFDVLIKDVKSDSFTRIVEFPDLTVETSWTCGEEGLVSLQYGSITTTGLDNFGINTLDVKGVTVPPAELWEIGYAWQNEYITQISIGMGDNSFTGQGSILLDYTIAGMDGVTVPAGTYDNAYQVDTVITITVDLAGSATTISTGSKDWFVENIGLVRSESSTQDFPFTLELLSME